jgi:hypothetical protein
MCNFRYILVYTPPSNQACRFALLVARDTIVCSIVLIGIIGLLGALTLVLDPDRVLMSFLPGALQPHPHSVYFAYGIVWFLALVGVIGSCLYCGGAFDDKGALADPPARHRHGPDCNCYCPGNHCLCIHSGPPCTCPSGGGGGGGGRGDGLAAALIVLLVIVLVAFVLIGIAFLIYIVPLFLQRLLKRHIHTLQVHWDVDHSEVHDFGEGSPIVPTAPEAYPIKGEATMSDTYPLELEPLATQG